MACFEAGMQMPHADESSGRSETVRSCLAKVLGNPLFAQAERQQRFLRYVVEQTLAGRGDRLKGYTIGAEVFDRDVDFDPRLDAIVRVEATRLRSKLREYYEAAGSGDAVRIELPKGCYQPTFVFRDLAAAAAKMEEVARAIGPEISVPTDKPSLAVLPFANLSADVEQEYFADGIAEELITALSKMSGLLVISRHSAFQYKGITKGVREIGRELGVRYLLEGSVRRSGNRVRVTAQLVEAESGMQVWAERYDRGLEDIFAMQDDVSRRIVEALQVKFAPGEAEALVHGGTTSTKAHDLLLQGLERFWLYTGESMEAAQELFHASLELDPNYAAAHAWICRAYVFRYASGFAGAEVLEIALGHARKAIEINPRMPIGYSVLAWVQLWRRQGIEAAGPARRAVAMDPNNADALLFLSIVLSAMGQGEEGLRAIEKGMRLNPHPSSFYLLAKGQAHFALRQYQEAALAFAAAVDLRPDFLPARRYLIITNALLGRDAEVSAQRALMEKTFARNEPRFRDVPTLWFDNDFTNTYQRGLKLAGLDAIP